MNYSGKNIKNIAERFAIMGLLDFLCHYLKHPATAHKVTGMWVAYYEAYQDKDREQKAWLPIEKTNARVLLIAGGADEAYRKNHIVSIGIFRYNCDLH